SRDHARHESPQKSKRHRCRSCGFNSRCRFSCSPRIQLPLLRLRSHLPRARTAHLHFQLGFEIENFLHKKNGAAFPPPRIFVTAEIFGCRAHSTALGFSPRASRETSRESRSLFPFYVCSSAKSRTNLRGMLRSHRGNSAQ